MFDLSVLCDRARKVGCDGGATGSEKTEVEVEARQHGPLVALPSGPRTRDLETAVEALIELGRAMPDADPLREPVELLAERLFARLPRSGLERADRGSGPT